MTPSHPTNMTPSHPTNDNNSSTARSHPSMHVASHPTHPHQHSGGGEESPPPVSGIIFTPHPAPKAAVLSEQEGGRASAGRNRGDEDGGVRRDDGMEELVSRIASASLAQTQVFGALLQLHALLQSNASTKGVQSAGLAPSTRQEVWVYEYVRCSALQSVAVCCRVLQSGGLAPSTRQEVWVYEYVRCSALQSVAVCCRVLQSGGLAPSTRQEVWKDECMDVRCSALQSVAVCRNVLQYFQFVAVGARSLDSTRIMGVSTYVCDAFFACYECV